MKKIFWLDMEMTGLDVTANRIIEVAVIVTDMNLQVVDKYEAVIKQPQEFLDQMDEWNTRTHGESGLTHRVRLGQPQFEVEMQLMALAEKHFGNDRIILAGSSISQDKLFIEKHMKKLATRLHFRIIDVSSMKAIFQWRYDVKFKRGKNHRALMDVEESIEELKLYLSFLDQSKMDHFIKNSGPNLENAFSDH